MLTSLARLLYRTGAMLVKGRALADNAFMRLDEKIEDSQNVTDAVVPFELLSSLSCQP